MTSYAVRVTARTGCGCQCHIDFDLPDGKEPKPGDVAAIMYAGLNPEDTDFLRFLMHEHADGGHEKVTVTAHVIVR